MPVGREGVVVVVVVKEIVAAGRSGFVIAVFVFGRGTGGFGSSGERG